MIERTTPETDALDCELHNPKVLSDRYSIMRDHSCRMERERDEAREALMKIKEIFIDGGDTYLDFVRVGNIATDYLEGL